MDKEREYISCGDGTCQFANRCCNYNSDHCYVCMYNTGATTRDYFEENSKEDELSEEEHNMIEN